jgi:hypothetical protein
MDETPKRVRRISRTFRISPQGDAAVAHYAIQHGLRWSQAARRLLAAGIAAERKEGR